MLCGQIFFHQPNSLFYLIFKNQLPLKNKEQQQQKTQNTKSVARSNLGAPRGLKTVSKGSVTELEAEPGAWLLGLCSWDAGHGVPEAQSSSCMQPCCLCLSSRTSAVIPFTNDKEEASNSPKGTQLARGGLALWNISIENILDYNNSLHLLSTSYNKHFTHISFIPHRCPELGTITYLLLFHI